MARTYNPDNETKVFLKDIEKNKRGDFIRVSAVINNQTGEKSYDIRNMYTTDSGEPGFTAKGVRLKSEMVKDVVCALMSDLDTEEYNQIISELDKISSVSADTSDIGQEAQG